MPWRDGSIYYGQRAKPREFTLECYFERITIEEFERITQWACGNNKGKLIFDDRPFVYYTVSPMKVPTGKVFASQQDGEIEKMYSGTVTLYFKAFEPFGCMAYKTIGEYDTDGAAKRSGMIREEMMPKLSAQAGTYLVYNPGTIACDTIIRIGGSAENGVTIINNTTGDVCKILALPSTGYIEVNGEEGSVKHLPTDPEGFAFEFHDEGYIRLAPCMPYYQNTAASYTSGSNKVLLLDAGMPKDLAGEYIYLNKEWLRIIAVEDENTVIVSKNMTGTGVEETIVANMNEITIECPGANLTRLEIDFIPKVR